MVAGGLLPEKEGAKSKIIFIYPTFLTSTVSIRQMHLDTSKFAWQNVTLEQIISRKD